MREGGTRPAASHDWELSTQLPPPPEVRDSCSRWRSSATSWPRQHRLPLRTEPAAPFSSLHTIVQWKLGERCFLEGPLPRPILNEIQGICVKNIYHTFNLMISLGLYIHLLGLT